MQHGETEAKASTNGGLAHGLDGCADGCERAKEAYASDQSQHRAPIQPDGDDGGSENVVQSGGSSLASSQGGQEADIAVDSSNNAPGVLRLGEARA